MQSKGLVPTAGADSLGDIGIAPETEDADGSITQAGHHPGSRANTHLGTVFVVSDVSYVVNPILDMPMITGEAEQTFRVSLLRCKTGDAVMNMFLAVLSLEIGCDAGDPKDLADMGQEWF